jgi:addiction module RelE/StbE family toxin
MRVLYSDTALQNLEAIRAYIAQDSVSEAGRMVGRLLTACRSLADLPDRGRAGRRSTRELTVVRPYVIVYRVTPDAIRIERVIHSARQR